VVVRGAATVDRGRVCILTQIQRNLDECMQME
jgi:hypothetical protein